LLTSRLPTVLLATVLLATVLLPTGRLLAAARLLSVPRLLSAPRLLPAARLLPAVTLCRLFGFAARGAGRRVIRDWRGPFVAPAVTARRKPIRRLESGRQLKIGEHAARLRQR